MTTWRLFPPRFYVTAFGVTAEVTEKQKDEMLKIVPDMKHEKVKPNEGAYGHPRKMADLR